jgi:glycosyltransferase involved in cell wall biosynthesis
VNKSLKILAISSQHPPDHAGGYELRVKEILDGLAQRGHILRMLTTLPERHGFREDPESRYPILRELHNRYRSPSFPLELLRDLADTRFLQKQVREFQPDVVYLGHTYILSKALLPWLARQAIPIYYDEGGSGLIEAWEDHGRWFRFCGDWHSRIFLVNWLKPLAAWMVNSLSRGRLQREWCWPGNLLAVFNSQLNLENALVKGVPMQSPLVLHSGIDLEKFRFKQRQEFGKPLQILVPGRLEKRKGQADAVKLLRALINLGIEANLKLAGTDSSGNYTQEINRLVITLNLQSKVTIEPMLTQVQLVEEYHGADICFFPSYQEIGFSRVPLEAMACGCLVLTYGNEGSDEVISDGETGFIVKAGDISSCVSLIQKMSSNPGALNGIQAAARARIEDRHALQNVLKRIEELLAGLTPTGKAD